MLSFQLPNHVNLFLFSYFPMFSLTEYGIWTTAGQNEQIQHVTLGFGETVIGFFIHEMSHK